MFIFIDFVGCFVFSLCYYCRRRKWKNVFYKLLKICFLLGYYIYFYFCYFVYELEIFEIKYNNIIKILYLYVYNICLLI